MEKSEKALRVVVFLTGLFEGGTSILMLFFPGVYEAMYGLSPDFDTYYLRQIGMFQFLVGSFILWGAFDRQLRPFALFAVYFHVVCLIFEGTYAFFIFQDHDLQYWTFVFFVVFHIVMITLLTIFMRRSGIGIAPPAEAG